MARIDLLQRARTWLATFEHIMSPGRSVMLLREAADEIERLRKELDGRIPSVAEAGRRGGKARATKLTAAQRTEIARKVANARWAKVKAAKGEG